MYLGWTLGGSAVKTRVPTLGRFSALLTDERIVAHNLIVGGGTILAGVLGVAFQSLVSHRLQPADYGAVFVVVSLITLVGLPASAFTLVMARETSRGRATGQQGSSAALLHNGNRTLVMAGIGLAGIVAVLSPLVAQFLAVPTSLVLAGAVGLPFTLALPLLVGEFQGEQRFVAMSMLLAGQAGLKLVAALALGIVWGPMGVIAGISVASALTYFVAVRMLRSKLRIRPRLPWFRPAASYLSIVVPSTLCLAILLSADVVLVKHYFSTQGAGEYSVVAAIGRAIFWGASGVAVVLFPKVVSRVVQGHGASQLVTASLAIVTIGGLAGVGILWLTSRWIVVSFAGPAYAAAAALLPWYGLGMILLGGVAVLIVAHQSIGKAGFLAVLIPLSVLETILLIAFHQTLTQVVQMVDLSMALVLCGLGALYVTQQRVSIIQLAAAPAATGGLANVGVNQ
jgi:O-antigen/teichoic acid export membrane protein